MKILARINWAYDSLIILTGLLIKILIFYVVPRPYASKIAAWFIRIFIFLRVRKIGTPDPDAQMLVVNHQSELDIGVLESITAKNLAWVAKKELFDIPLFSLSVRLSKEIPLERESKSALVALFNAAKERIDDGRTLCIFPEGTRSETGKMRPFKPGAKMIAEKLALKIQPVVLIDTAHFYSSKRREARPGTILVIFLPSFIPPKKEKNWFAQLQSQMQQTYDLYAATKRTEVIASR